MKLSRDRLKQIIKEELQTLMAENVNSVEPITLAAALSAAGMQEYANAVKKSGQQRLNLRSGPNGSVIVDQSMNPNVPQPLFNIDAASWDKVKANLH